MIIVPELSAHSGCVVQIRLNGSVAFIQCHNHGATLFVEDDVDGKLRGHAIAGCSLAVRYYHDNIGGLDDYVVMCDSHGVPLVSIMNLKFDTECPVCHVKFHPWRGDAIRYIADHKHCHLCNGDARRSRLAQPLSTADEAIYDYRVHYRDSAGENFYTVAEINDEAAVEAFWDWYDGDNPDDVELLRVELC